MNSYDGEIGRGRRRGSGNDSSSSRESSPVRPAPKRAFSPPNSDDEGAMVPTAANDETPPPQPQPLLRQAMAFASAKPTAFVASDKPPQIVTYEAAPPTLPEVGVFLPGQQVPIPLKPKPQKPKKTVGTGSKRPRKGDAYPGQTTRFRITTYDPTPSAEPPIHAGNGRYNALYRSVTVPPNTGRQDSPAAVSTSSNGGYPSSSTASSNPAKAHALTRSASMASKASASARSQPPPAERTRPPPEKSRPLSSSYTEAQRPPPSQRNYYPQHYAPPPPPSTADSSTYAPSSSSTVGPYYRRNYEAEVWEREPSRSPPPQRGPGRPPNHPQASGSSSRYQNRDSGPYGQNTESPKRSKFPLRMVTLLIQDVRSGTTDHQLAEVKVPLRPGDNPEDGFWADARDISEQLQMGPSRVDGPAKAYTLRGKYRQFILRVSAQNVDEFLTANVVIQPDRTLDLIVEMLYPPGAPPPPPKIPTESWNPEYDDYDRDTPSDRMDVDSRRGSPLLAPLRKESQHEIRDSRKRANSPHFDDYDGLNPAAPPYPVASRGSQHEIRDVDSRRGSQHEIRDSRKRVNSPSFDDYDGPDPAAQPHPVVNKVARHEYAWENSPRQSPRHASPRSSNRSSLDSGPPRKRRSSAREHPTHPFSHTPDYAVPQRPPPSPPAPPNVLYATRSDRPERESPPAKDEFMRELEALVQKEDKHGFLDFFRANAGMKNSDVLKQYTFIMKFLNNLTGKKIAGFEQPIQEMHIIQAMRIDDENYLNTCKETMRLLDLYGEKAGHYHDPRVTELIEDPKASPYNVNPRKKILRFLRDIDDAWNNGRPEQPRPPSRDSEQPPEGPEASLVDPSRHVPRATKGMFVQ